MLDTTAQAAPITPARRTAAGASLAYASFGWALAPIFIRYLSGAYEPFGQMLVRYGTATLVLIVVCLLAYRAEFLRTLRRVQSILPLAAVMIGHQTVWTVANYGATPTVAQLTTKLSVVLIVVFSFLLFHEERAVIRHPLYLFGTFLSFVGMAGVLAKDAYSLMPNLDRYAVLLLFTAFFWAVYVVWAKHLVGGIHPVPLFAVLAIWTTVGIAILAFTLGEPGRILHVGPRITLVAVVSGLIPVASAHPAYHYAQRHLGAAVCSSFNLLNPLMTYAFALLIWPDEHLLPTQWAGAAVLLLGTLMVTLAAHRTSRLKLET